MVLHKWAGSGGWYWNHHGTAQVGALVGGTGTTMVLHMWAGSGGWYWCQHGTAQVGRLW